MIHLDTNFLIGAMTAGSPQDRQLREWAAAGEAVNIDALVWTEFLCGPVMAAQVQLAQTLFPNPEPYLPTDATRAADLYNQTGRRRGTLVDCMIAACAIRSGAQVATANLDDFRPFVRFGLQLA